MNKEVIKELDSLEVGDLVWWREEGQQGIVIGIVAEMFDDEVADALWKAEFADGEHCFWGEFYHDFVEDGMMGAI